MKKFISLLFISALFFVPASLRASDDEMDEVFKKMAEKISDIEKKLPNKTVAVYGFEMVDGKDNEFAKYATEKITHYIVEEGELTVIERRPGPARARRGAGGRAPGPGGPRPRAGVHGWGAAHRRADQGRGQGGRGARERRQQVHRGDGEQGGRPGPARPIGPAA